LFVKAPSFKFLKGLDFLGGIIVLNRFFDE